MLTFVLVAITVLFFVIALLKPAIRRLVPWKICSLCSSVVLTWMSLLVALWIGLPVDPVLLGILMGESVTGVLIALSGYSLRSRYPLLPLLIVLSGTSLAYFLIRQQIVSSSLLVLVVVTLLALLFKPSRKSASPWRKRLERQLEKCCS